MLLVTSFLLLLSRRNWLLSQPATARAIARTVFFLHIGESGIIESQMCLTLWRNFLNTVSRSSRLTWFGNGIVALHICQTWTRGACYRVKCTSIVSSARWRSEKSSSWCSILNFNRGTSTCNKQRVFFAVVFVCERKKPFTAFFKSIVSYSHTLPSVDWTNRSNTKITCGERGHDANCRTKRSSLDCW